MTTSLSNATALVVEAIVENVEAKRGGWHTGAIAVRLVVDHTLAGSESFGSPGLACVKYRHPVRAGVARRL